MFTCRRIRKTGGEWRWLPGTKMIGWWLYWVVQCEEDEGASSSRRLCWLLGKRVDKDYCVGEREGAHGDCSWCRLENEVARLLDCCWILWFWGGGGWRNQSCGGGGEKKEASRWKTKGGTEFFQTLHLDFFPLNAWNPPLFIGVEEGYFISFRD